MQEMNREKKFLPINPEMLIAYFIACGFLEDDEGESKNDTEIYPNPTEKVEVQC